MKKVKILFAIITVVAMLSTVAFASTLKFDAATTDVDGDKLVLSVFAGADVTLKKSASFTVLFDTSAWEYAGIENGLAGMQIDDSLVEDLSLIEVVFNKNDVTAIATDNKVCDLTFTKKVADAYGTKFTLAASEELGNNLYTSTGTELDYNAIIEVKAAGPKTEPKVEKLNAKRDLTVNNTTWKDLAIYEANFVLADIVATEDYGITDGTNKLNVAVAGEGTTNFVLAFYGVSDAELATMNISSYCTVPVVEK